VSTEAQGSLIPVPRIRAGRASHHPRRAIGAGDIVLVDKKGRRFHALVTELQQLESGRFELALRPLDSRVSWRIASVREVVEVCAPRGPSHAGVARLASGRLDDDGPQIGYQALTARHCRVVSSEGVEVGYQSTACSTTRSGAHLRRHRHPHTREGRRFVDAPEVARITERHVTLTITAEDAAWPPGAPRSLPDRPPPNRNPDGAARFGG